MVPRMLSWITSVLLAHDSAVRLSLFLVQGALKLRAPAARPGPARDGRKLEADARRGPRRSTGERWARPILLEWRQTISRSAGGVGAPTRHGNRPAPLRTFGGAEKGRDVFTSSEPTDSSTDRSTEAAFARGSPRDGSSPEPLVQVG